METTTVIDMSLESVQPPASFPAQTMAPHQRCAGVLIGMPRPVRRWLAVLAMFTGCALAGTQPRAADGAAPAESAAPAAQTAPTDPHAGHIHPTAGEPQDAQAVPAPAAAASAIAAEQPSLAADAPADKPTEQAMAPEPGLLATPAIDIDQLPRNLSPWSMFMSADIVVKAVMVLLAFASLMSWTVWLSKSLELAIAKSRLRRSLLLIRQAKSLGDAADLVPPGRDVAAQLVRSARAESLLSGEVGATSRLLERVHSRFVSLVSSASRRMNVGTGLLATVGSTGPFVGLFGTVWGIMNSFIGISKAQTTNLSIVAPGIAEALLATAIGLVAAIPAVVFYNLLVRGIAGYKALAGEAADELMRHLSRDLDRPHQSHQARAAE